MLDGESATYTPFAPLQGTLEYDFARERQFSYAGLSAQEAINHIGKFISGLWQLHPFREGNTRTTAVFTIRYLRKFGFHVNNEPCLRHSWYFRNALVRANYDNYTRNISATTVYLERFFENLVFHGINELKSRFCHISLRETASARSATPKCKNCTLDESAVLEYLADNPR